MNKIKKMREARKMTQAQLAKRIGVSRSTIAKWETNVSNPRIKSLVTLSRVFSCKVDDLVILRRKT